MKEILVVPKDVRSHEFQVKAQRLDAKSKMNIENLVKNTLKKIGALKITLPEIKFSEDKAVVTASFLFEDKMRKTTFNLVRDGFANWNIKEFDASIEAAEFVKEEKKEYSNFDMGSDELVIDLSIIKAIQKGNEYLIEHPVIGKIGSLEKDEITENNIKVLMTLFAGETGAKIKYINNFQVDFKDESFVYDEPSYNEINSKDPMMQTKREIVAYTKIKSEDKNVTIRENFNKVICMKAENIVKKQAYSWKEGIPQIISTNSFVEIKDGKYNGNVLIKAKIGTQEKTFALPVIKGNLMLKKELNAYIIDENEFVDIVKNSIESHLKEVLKDEMDLISNKEKEDIENLASNKIEAIRTQDVLKTFRIAKVNLKDTEPGDIINLSGIKYKVEPGTNDAYFNLVLVD
jgi:hypothetical protein